MSENKEVKPKVSKAKEVKNQAGKNQDFTAKTLLEVADDKLRESLAFLKKELFNLRFQVTLGELTNTSRFAKARKDVARVKTEISRRKNVGAK